MHECNCHLWRCCVSSLGLQRSRPECTVTMLPAGMNAARSNRITFGASCGLTKGRAVGKAEQATQARHACRASTRTNEQTNEREPLTLADVGRLVHACMTGQRALCEQAGPSGERAALGAACRLSVASGDKLLHTPVALLLHCIGHAWLAAGPGAARRHAGQSGGGAGAERAQSSSRQPKHDTHAVLQPERTNRRTNGSHSRWPMWACTTHRHSSAEAAQQQHSSSSRVPFAFCESVRGAVSVRPCAFEKQMWFEKTVRLSLDAFRAPRST